MESSRESGCRQELGKFVQFCACRKPTSTICRFMLFSKIPSGQIEDGVEPVFPRQRAQLLPGRILDLDAVAQALLLAHALDLAGIVDALAALGRRRRFEVMREFGDLALELLQRAKCRDVEYRHEASVIVSPRGLDTEAETGQQAAQHLDHGRKAAPLVALGAAERQ